MRELHESFEVKKRVLRLTIQTPPTRLWIRKSSSYSDDWLLLSARPPSNVLVSRVYLHALVTPTLTLMFVVVMSAKAKEDTWLLKCFA